MGRVNISGVIFIEPNDTPTHEVEVGKVDVDGQEVFIDLIRSWKLQGWGEFLPARVFTKASDAPPKDLWNFKQEEREGFRGNGKLINCGELVIALVDRDQRIVKVIPIADLPKIQRVKVGDKIELIGGRGPQEIFNLKVAVAKYLVLEFVASEEEKKMLAVIRQYEEAEKTARRVARETARQERFRRILDRPILYGFSEDGKRCFGTPVTEEEWPSLPNRTPVILVESYDDETQTAGKIIEAFFVKKNGRQPEKCALKIVAAEKPRRNNSNNSDDAVEAKGSFLAIIGGKVEKIPVLSKEGIAALRKKEVNGKMLVALDQVDEEGRYPIEDLGCIGKTICLATPIPS